MFLISSRDSIRRYAFQFALKIALNVSIMAGLIIIRPIVRQLAGQLLSAESKLVITSPPIYGSHRNDSALQDMSIYATILGSLVYSLLFFGVSVSQDERERVRAILGTFFLAKEIVRERVGRLIRTVAYPVKTAWMVLHQILRACLETMPKYLEFRACLGVTIRLLMVTFCLFFFALGIAIAIAYHHGHRQPLSKCLQFVSCDLYWVILDITDHAEALLNTVLTIVTFLFALRFLVRSLLSSIAFISYRDVKARPKPSLLIEKQDIANHEDKRPSESNRDALCDTVDLKEDDGDVSPQVQEVVSLPNDGKEDGLNQQSEVRSRDGIGFEQQQAVINRLPSATKDLKHASSPAHGPPSRVVPVRSMSLQQVQKLGSQARFYRSSLSASSQEFVPRYRNRAPAHNYCPPYWAPAPPVSVRITAPVKRDQQNAEMAVSPMALGRLRGTPELPV